MVNARSWICLFLVILAFCLILPEPMLAQTTARCPAPVGAIVSAQGVIEIKAALGDTWIRAAVMTLLCPGDIIRAGPRSRGEIALYKHGENLALDERTTIQIVEPGRSDSSLIDVVTGAIYVSWKKLRTAFGRSEGLEIKTPFVNGRVEGTEFLVRVESRHTMVTVLEGRVQLANEHGSLVLTSTQSAIALEGQAPQIRILVRPRDAVQWAMYYQPIMSPLTDSSSPNTAKALQESYEEFSNGNLTRAFEFLDQMPETDRDANFYIQRAGLLLGVGQLDPARSDIDRAFALSPENGQAYALKTVIAVAQNDREQALLNGRKAVERSPDSPAAQIALSYGLQANLKLEAARDVLIRTVEAWPGNAIAWARLAELWLSLGRLDRALETGRTAISKQPNLGQAHTVLGFAYLAQTKISQAKTAFEKAISLESASPLAHLGFGLAKIRDGDLAEGRRDIEIASTLDPNNSLIRSYLGKAYYEEKRKAQAEEQFSLAKELDPQDPTPYFYDAIRKQTVNRPVEALHDLQKSIELNDNRAVYRSRLLMDEDLAARSAGLGRIYRDLGFEQLALVEGWNSLNLNPANYSAHRFLADSYSTLPRHEIARVSELLQSQLRQPINITPLQPQLTENNLFILSGAGPSEAAFNEFNPLFARDRIALQADVVGGLNDTFGDDVVLSGVQGKVSFSAGQFHYQTDGFRENNSQEQSIYNAYIQASLSYKTSIQAEFRSADTRKGDLALRFDPANFSAAQRNNDFINTLRFGLHHAFTPKSDIIASFIGQRSDLETRESYPPLGNIILQNDIDSYIAEMQYLYRSDHYNIVSGAGHFGAEVESVQDIFGSVLKDEPQQRHTNAYSYLSIPYPKNVTLTAGASVDFFKEANLNRHQINPKLGLTWKPLPKTTIRLAAFRALKRTLVADQTIEPTQVAGFNQFFDDENGVDTRRFGVAVDQKFASDLYAGVELSKRDLRITRFNPIAPSPMKFKWEERMDRVYLYWMPHPWIAGTAEYQHERFEKPSPTDVIVLNSETALKTHRIPLGLSFYHPSGLSGRIKFTYVDQSGTFIDNLAMTVPGQDNFWVFDGAITYRLPNRYGLITLGANNLFDKSFRFQDIDPRNPSLYPERMIYTRLTLAF
jgi:tetratricopeptide (TPR) repeat protein